MPVVTIPALVKLTRLRVRREAAGLTQDQLAELVGISRQSLGKLERGDTEPRPSTIVRLARALGCEPKDLMAPGTLD